MSLTHIDSAGDARMVDVGEKPVTHRRARARGRIFMQAQTLRLIESHGHPKGDVLATARIAGIMGAKRTAELVPLCHPLSLTHIDIDLVSDPGGPALCCEASVETHARTGVEIEALCAVQVCLLTIYDMCKAADRGMHIEEVRVIEKSGGRSGHWQAPNEPHEV